MRPYQGKILLSGEAHSSFLALDVWATGVFNSVKKVNLFSSKNL